MSSFSGFGYSGVFQPPRPVAASTSPPKPAALVREPTLEAAPRRSRNPFARNKSSPPQPTPAAVAPVAVPASPPWDANPWNEPTPVRLQPTGSSNTSDARGINALSEGRQVISGHTPSPNRNPWPVGSPMWNVEESRRSPAGSPPPITAGSPAPAPPSNLPPGAGPTNYTSYWDSPEGRNTALARATSIATPPPSLPRRPQSMAGPTSSLPLSPTSTGSGRPPALPPRNSIVVQSPTAYHDETAQNGNRKMFARSSPNPFARDDWESTLDNLAAGPLSPAPVIQPPTPQQQQQPEEDSEPEFSTFDLGLRDILRDAMDQLVQAHKDDIFLVSSSAAPRPSPLQRESSSSSSDAPHDKADPATATFLDAFPSLSRSPSPDPSTPPLLPPTSSEANNSGFSDKAMRTTGLLMWQVKRHVDEEVDREALQWREEKARGLAEFESMEAEADEERMRRIQVEEELMSLRREVVTLRESSRLLSIELNEERTSHNLDLEAAAHGASELAERVEILQSALNDPDNQPRQQNDSQDDGDNVWSTMLDAQAEILTKHTDAITELEDLLNCPVCTEVYTRATTLPCGHSACADCAEGWFKNNRLCMVCRAPVPPGSARLVTTFALEGVIEVLKKVGLGEDGDD